jgi:hypothetical protein
MADAGSLGIYCPARALAILEPRIPVRFFDDDPTKLGKYLPPFHNIIESRDQLFSYPVNSLVIISRTFGQKILRELLARDYPGRIMTIDEL